MTRHALRSRTAYAAIAVVAALAFAAPAAAQSSIPAYTPDPALVRLQERMDALEGQLRQTTGEAERLSFELRQAQQQIRRLEKHVADLLARTPALDWPQGGAAGVGAAPAPAPAAAAAAANPPAASPAAAPSAPAAARGAATGGDEAFTAAVAARNRGDFDGAEQAFRAFVEGFPGHAREAEGRYWLGRSLLARGAHADAAAEFVRVLKEHGRAPIVPDSYVFLGVALRELGQREQACAAFGEFTRRYPQAPAPLKSTAARERRLAECAA